MTVDRQFYVVLCCHNGARYIEAQVNSIIAQGDSITKILIHDFASKDATRQYLQALAAAEPDRVELFFHDDAPGAAQSFIRAIRQISPRLDDNALVFLSDQDDVWLNDKIETIDAELVRQGLTAIEPFILFHDVRVVNDELNVIRETYYSGNPFALPRDLDFGRLILANPAIGHTMLLSPPLLKALASWPIASGFLMHDWLAILIASRIGRLAYINQPLSLYRQHDANILGAYRTRSRWASFARLLSFSDKLVIQARTFAQSVEAARSSPGIKIARQSQLERHCQGGYRRAAIALAVAAAIRGPTWQRKAISGLLMTRAVLGPRADEARSGT